MAVSSAIAHRGDDPNHGVHGELGLELTDFVGWAKSFAVPSPRGHGACTILPTRAIEQRAFAHPTRLADLARSCGMEGSAAVHRDRCSYVIGEHEDGSVERRRGNPPPQAPSAREARAELPPVAKRTSTAFVLAPNVLLPWVIFPPAAKDIERWCAWGSSARESGDPSRDTVVVPRLA
jgi:hypothetical protein